MGGGELHLESSRQPGDSKDLFQCRHNSKEHHLSDLKVESAMICSLEIEHHGKSPQIMFSHSSQGQFDQIIFVFCLFFLQPSKIMTDLINSVYDWRPMK